MEYTVLKAGVASQSASPSEHVRVPRETWRKRGPTMAGSGTQESFSLPLLSFLKMQFSVSGLSCNIYELVVTCGI